MAKKNTKKEAATTTVIEKENPKENPTDELLISLGHKPSTLRFSEASWAHQSKSKDIIIGGTGGIGSWLTLFLSRISIHNLHLFDYDKFEEVNLAGQFFSKSQLGKLKTEGVKNSIIDLGFVDKEVGDQIFPYNEKLTEDNINDFVLPVVFSCFDNMEARTLLFEAWAKQPDREIFIDGRAVAEYYEVYTCKKGQEDKYRETLFSDNEGSNGICSYKSTSHCSAMVAGDMVNSFNQYLTTGSEYFDIPFKKVYSMGIGGSYTSSF